MNNTVVKIIYDFVVSNLLKVRTVAQQP